MTTAIFIPARMESTRLPGKPLADINGKPMIIRVMERAAASLVGDVVVACSNIEVKQVVEASGGIAVMTDPAHPSGTDRIFEAMRKLGKNYDIIVNVQGDLPTIEPSLIRKSVELLNDKNVDIGTLAAVIKRNEERENPNVVKAVISFKSKDSGRALYFTRATAPHGEGELYHHIGLYAYKREALERFVSLKPSELEKREKLEQLRALENDMRIDVAVIDTVPLGVDTEEDLIRARELLK